MPRDLRGQPAESLDHEHEQDGLRSAQAALDHLGIFVHEKKGFAEGL
jgi:hypothetical protein